MTANYSRLALCLGVFGLLAAPAAESKTMYRVEEIPEPSNPQYPIYGSQALAINDAGAVSGALTYQTTPNNREYRAFKAAADASMVDLKAIVANGQSSGSDIDSTGNIVGWSTVMLQGSNGYSFGSSHAVVIDNNGNFKDLGALGGNSSGASAVNNAGQVVGAAAISVANFDQHAFLTTISGGQMVDLGTLGGKNSVATAINASGLIAGYSQTPTDKWHAFITGANGVEMRDLTPDNLYSNGNDINDAGQVAGVFRVASDQYNLHAFVTAANGDNPTQLQGLNDLDSAATGINNAGQLIGTYTHKQFGARAFIGTAADHQAQDLNKLLIVDKPTSCAHLEPNDINNNGQIVGSCSEDKKRTNMYAVRLIPEEVVEIASAKSTSFKLSESLKDAYKCDQTTQTCKVITGDNGSHSLTIKLPAATLTSHGITLGQIQTNTSFGLSIGAFSYTGSLATSSNQATRLPASWDINDDECIEYDPKWGDCSKTQAKKIGLLKISADKKGNLTLTLKGRKSTVGLEKDTLGWPLLADLCPTTTPGTSELTEAVMLNIGPSALPMTVKLSCKLKQTKKTIAKTKERYTLNNISLQATLAKTP